MDNHTAPALLEAVGVEWRADDTYWYLKCDTCGNAASRGCHCEPFDKKFGRHYAGPALGTPDLDALLLVAGQRWLRAANREVYFEVLKELYKQLCGTPKTGWTWGEKSGRHACWKLMVNRLPGHALARAIAEVRG